MSEHNQEEQAPVDVPNTGSNEELQEEPAPDSEDVSAQEDSQAQDDYGSESQEKVYNNHDLIGVEGIIRAQKNEIEKKKLELRIENEKYFRQHPELACMTQLFIFKVLDDRPENILQYAGNFFDRAELHEVVKKFIEESSAADSTINYLNDLIKGKTLIE